MLSEVRLETAVTSVRVGFAISFLAVTLGSSSRAHRDATIPKKTNNTNYLITELVMSIPILNMDDFTFNEGEH